MEDLINYHLQQITALQSTVKSLKEKNNKLKFFLNELTFSDLSNEYVNIIKNEYSKFEIEDAKL